MVGSATSRLWGLGAFYVPTPQGGLVGVQLSCNFRDFLSEGYFHFFNSKSECKRLFCTRKLTTVYMFASGFNYLHHARSGNIFFCNSPTFTIVL